MDIQRIKTAVEFLKDGLPFKVEHIRLSRSQNTIEVAGWSQTKIFSNINRAISKEELMETKNLFCEMLNLSPELQSYVADKKIEFVLYYNDSGKASIEICSEKNGIFECKL